MWERDGALLMERWIVNQKAVDGARRWMGLAAGVVCLMGVMAVVGCDGTGETSKTYRYPGGQVKLVDEYRGDEIVKSTWFLPDGTTFRTTVWDKGTGTGFYLDDLGRVTVEMPYVRGLAEGTVIYFSYEGGVQTFQKKVFAKGVEVGESGGGGRGEK